MWVYVAGAIIGVTGAAIGHVWWRSVKEGEDLYIDMERVNREARDQELAHAEDESSDMCKARVKRRMKLGEACKEPPLFNGKKGLHLVQAKRAG
jgi:hypothetical protein